MSLLRRIARIFARVGHLVVACAAAGVRLVSAILDGTIALVGRLAERFDGAMIALAREARARRASAEGTSRRP